MFTGIVRHVGRIAAATAAPSGRALTIELGPLAEGLGLGDSVAVDGACLTAAGIDGERVRFDVVAETLERTTLGRLRVADRVNCERSLTLADALDGHLVQGHVDGVARVAGVDRSGGRWEMDLAADHDLTAQMVPKGSVALAGVSLTLIEVGQGRFRVALIPTTLTETTLGELRPGDRVNVETDLIGKYVRKALGATGLPAAGGVTMDRLRRTGFA